MRYCFFVLLFVLLSTSQCVQLAARSLPVPNTKITSWIKRELAHIYPVKQQFNQFLSGRNVSRSSLHGSLKWGESENNSRLPIARVAISTIENPYECRLSFDTVPIGRKVVSPCKCSGTQKWVQFCSMNRARRMQPSEWARCSTCQSDMDFSFLPTTVTPKSLAISGLLNHRALLRVLIAGTAALAATPLLEQVVLRFLTSTLFWQQYPSWSQLYHFPLIAKLWILQELFRYFVKLFESLENRIVGYLADVESSLLEPLLVVDPT